MTVFIFGSLLLALCPSLLNAGDAVAIGYNSEGVWTAVSYYNSSTPPGGADYKPEVQARQEAMRDLGKRAPEGLSKTEILGSSDSTHYVAVARGKNRGGNDENVIGYGKSQQEADRNAFARLKQLDAARKQKIVYRYFSYGTDPK